ncbi:2-oxoglutarate receptor 1-like [Acanthopagrus schlegelii]
MADFSINNTSQDFSYDNNTSNSHSDDPAFYSKVIYVVACVRKDHVVPIYVINLLISDLIQLCCLIPLVTDSGSVMKSIIRIIYIYSLMVSIFFMVCIALARYLVIACPLWYRFRHTIKFSVVLCVVVWVLSPVSYFMITFLIGLRNGRIAVGTFFLLPLPLLIFFLGGTIRALSASRVPSDEKRRIVGILVLVLLIYTLLFLPAIILSMAEKDIHHLPLVANVFVKLSPLADLFLYVFMRKGTIDKFLASVCCCRMDSNDSSRMDSNDSSRMDSNDISSSTV